MQIRMTYANVTSTLALVVAVSGGAYAVTTLPYNSVGTPQLRNYAVTQPKLGPHAVGPNQIYPHAVGPYQLSGTVLSNLGMTGYQQVLGTGAVIGAGTSSGRVSVSCPVGTKALGGGAEVSNQTYGVLIESFPSISYATNPPTYQWTVSVRHDGSTGSLSFTPYVICAKGS